MMVEHLQLELVVQARQTAEARLSRLSSSPSELATPPVRSGLETLHLCAIVRDLGGGHGGQLIRNSAAKFRLDRAWSASKVLDLRLSTMAGLTMQSRAANSSMHELAENHERSWPKRGRIFMQAIRSKFGIF